MLLDKIQTQMTQALKNRDAVRLETLRFLLSAIRYQAIDKYGAGSETKVTDDDVITVVKKQVKTHQEAIDLYQKAGRDDLAGRESQQLAILVTFLPAQMDDQKLRDLLSPIIKSGETDFGAAMGQAMKLVAGRASGERVSTLVTQMIKGK
ncbi:hypothetical protein A2154_02440 [Candidatus Gottesmanbacteria bacterium RBG_16_43_7]|uniref:Glutamyl-tRNA amidotransferase n=1 Tax=Candidatus Gottesmanbacteria bacterium RBG_16_43_7 TaxID=1798373 RepID=A0A1F5ZBQ9_9BACT|nr:MAG: hypothetical protein A2154_02440 [Candidatus Gottesmanbacteria bacterium RBG_16_43_7]